MKYNQLEPSELKAFLERKCPRCRKGSLFPDSTNNILNFGKVNQNCRSCGLRFEVEPGFFTGAMYFSYAINVFIIAFTGILINVFFTLHIYTVILIVIGVIFMFLPITFRYSRMIMMYFFSGVKYNSSIGQT